MIGSLLSLPFTNPRFLLFSYAAPDAKVAVMGLAQAQHRAIVDAIRTREPLRAEVLMREHGLLPVQTLRNILADAERMKRLPSRALLDLSTAAP
jgi:GntR family transcriptional regulator of vanillate catabolism